MSEKHKRNITEELNEQQLNRALSTVKSIFETLAPKQQHIMAEWLATWLNYIKFEKNFLPQRLKYYKRGDVILVHFGYNTGSELGGKHYAVVVEKNNNKSNNTIIVVPISSLDEGKTEADLYKSDVYLDVIIPSSDKRCFAKVSQIRAISKLRIITPKTKFIVINYHLYR